MEKNESEKSDFSDNDLDKENKFCSQSENKKNNKKEIKNQIIELTGPNDNYKFESNSYILSDKKKLSIKWKSTIKKNLLNKYWIINPKHKYDFFGKEIKNLSSNTSISKLKHLIGILMIFKNDMTKNEVERFDNYFAIIIKSYERQYYNNSNFGKVLYIGGDLKNDLGDMLKKEFETNNDDNILPIHISIMVYDEYEKIELDAYEYCDIKASHDGFGLQKIFINDFPKMLSKKVRRIQNEKNIKKQKLLEEEKNIIKYLCLNIRKFDKNYNCIISLLFLYLI